MTVTIALFAFPLFIYVGWRLSAAISGRFKVSKKIVLGIVLAVILYLYIYPVTIKVTHLTGNIDRLFVFEPSLHWQDYLLMYPFWIGLIAVAEIISFFALLDIISLISRLKIFAVSFRQKWRKVQEYLKIAIAVFFLLYAGIRSYIDTNQVRVSDFEVKIEKLPAELHHLKLCFSGDIHVDRYTQDKKLSKLKTMIRSGEEDLLLFSGDLITGGRTYIKPALDIMCNPRARIGSIACMGDHDFWTDSRGIPPKMKGCGWDFLQNEHKLFTYKGRKILVTGITYIYSRKLPRTELNRLLARAPQADLKILLVHQPLEIPAEAAAKYGYHLLLGGHTHGAQMVPHFFGIPLAGSLGETPYYTGRYRLKDLHIIVTNGIGLTLAPLRYHAPAEITGITLLRRIGNSTNR